ncbi:hypothetical protein [Arenibaculum pallidiluteum]|uniref:hypothetical protein n=1 Tax=Arenibaculum pallidiluteum TaxID=2812559 RepID=UPI001A96B0A8|nr:hypothetical protein [Arenibaculum pallidiluteum]
MSDHSGAAFDAGDVTSSLSCRFAGPRPVAGKGMATIDRNATSAISTYDIAQLEGANEIVALRAAMSELCEAQPRMTSRRRAKGTAKPQWSAAPAIQRSRSPASGHFAVATASQLPLEHTFLQVQQRHELCRPAFGQLSPRDTQRVGKILLAQQTRGFLEYVFWCEHESSKCA